MTYIDGFILPISDDKVADYTPMAETFARKAKEQGALGSLEALGDRTPKKRPISTPRPSPTAASTRSIALPATIRTVKPATY